LDYIDQLFLKIRLQAENKMKRQYKDWWHTDLKVWKQELKQLNNTLKKLKQQSPNSTTQIISISAERQSIITKFREHTQHSFQIQHQILQQEIKSLETTNKDKSKRKINHLKSILRIERIRELYQRKSTKITPHQQSQPRLQVQHQDLSVVEITDTSEMANHIAEYNKLHFNQAKDTPLSTYKLSFTNLESTEKSPLALPYTTQMDTDILNNKAYLQQR
jgi:hypothetical protein